MLKVMIADDNKAICNSLKDSIHWAELGYDLVATAYDGEDAYRKALLFRPDVLITDIKMPCHSGFDLIEMVSEQLPACRFIIITGYGKFEFAHRAIHLAVSEYILKPIDDQKVIQALEKIAGRGNRPAASEPPPAPRLAEPLTRRAQILRTLEEDQPAPFPGVACFVMLVLQPRDASQPPVPLSALASPRLKGFETVLCEVDHLPCCTLLAAADPGSMQMERAAELAARFLLDRCPGRLRAGISAVLPGDARLTEGYHGALEALDNLFFFPELDCFSLISRRSTLQPASWELPQNAYHRLLELLCCADLTREAAVDTLREILQGVPRNVKLIKTTVMELCVTCKFLSSREEFLFSEDGDNFVSLYQSLLHQSSFDRTLNFAGSYIASLCRREHLTASQLSPPVKRCLEYMNIHYAERIRLQDLCALANASPSHLSRLIKKETGQNFVDLLNSIRINKSIRLIRSGNYRLYEVANLVGIPNYAYFYQLFKKHIGIAPTDYLFQNKDEP